MSDADDPTPRVGIEVLNRAVDVLTAFTRGPGTVLSLAELARRTGLPKPTLHRLLATLDALCLVERTANGYQLGIRLFELGEHVPRKQRLREAALPFLQDLFEASHDTVHLAVLDGTDVVYLERIRGHHSVKPASRVGGRLPAFCTGVGKAQLAFVPDAIAAVMAMPLVARTAYTVTDHQVLAAQLERVRETGIAFDREENTIGVVCVAAPILVDGRPVGAVSVTCAQPTDPERYASAVKFAALGIRRALSPAARLADQIVTDVRAGRDGRGDDTRPGGIPR